MGDSQHSQRVFEFQGVHKSFGPKVVYQSMNLSIDRGETLVIIGGSGSGKSVCLKLMTGLLHANQGSVQFHGKEVSEMDAAELKAMRTQVAMVFQGGALFDSMTVEENVAYALVEHTTMGDKEIRARVEECLDMVGLGQSDFPHLRASMPAALSGGMRKRVAIARAIALKPQVILYDEPTTGLDPANCNRLALMIRQLQATLRVTSVVVTHDMDTAWHVADRVAMLHRCHFPFCAPIDEFRKIKDPVLQDFIEGKAT